MVAIFDPLTQGLLDKFRDAMDSLEIPCRPEDCATVRRPNDFRNLNWVNQTNIFSNDVLPMLTHGPRAEYGHNIRVSLYGLAISDILKFGKDAAVLKWVTDVSHDEGKLAFRDCYDLAKFDPVARERIKLGHVYHKHISTIYGIPSASAKEQHHMHQQTVSPYPNPNNLHFSKTPESFVLSQLLAIPDFYDAVFSRPDMNTGFYISGDEAVKKTDREYGPMKISYNGKMFPEINTTGRDLLEDLLDRGIIGRNAQCEQSAYVLRVNPFIDFEILKQ